MPRAAMARARQALIVADPADFRREDVDDQEHARRPAVDHDSRFSNVKTAKV